MTNEQKALGKAVEAIYFNDSADYESALWKIVELLGGNEAVGLLEAVKRAVKSFANREEKTNELKFLRS